MNLTIGSGDIKDLLMKHSTKGYQNLWRKFLSEDSPYYNAYASPIDALRTGAILEANYLQTLSDDYYIQHKVTDKEQDVFTCSIDFAKLAGGKVVDFDELKTIWFTDFIDQIKTHVGDVDFVKQNFKINYNQIQNQLMNAELESANLVFLLVDSYVDDENKLREIKPNDYVKFRIERDEAVISQIRKEGAIFQTVKDNFK